jgi:uncharacterized protein (TIGR03790 family)
MPLAFSVNAAEEGAPAAPVTVAQWAKAPKTGGRITEADLGLVINTADPYSEAVGAYYIEKRRLKESQVLRVSLPVRPTLAPEEFANLKQEIDERFGPKVQALALAWIQPYAVQCHSITGALALGFDADLCRQTCGRSRASPYFNSATSRPFTDKGMRLAMLLAAPDIAQAKSLVDRGVAADRSLGWRGAPPVTAYYLSTQDAARNVRARVYPPAGLLRRHGVQVEVEQGEALHDKGGLLLYQTGLAKVPGLDSLGWVNGALADHLTSFGGQLEKQGGQTTALAWIASGATASYGAVTEPCNHLQKFPHPQLLLLHYLQGSSAIEAYWKSVAWPQQGVFVGEPLAAPFAR